MVESLAQVLVLGVIAGTIYGLFALGITLVYRGTRAVNFAQGEIGTFSLYTAYLLTEVVGLPWILGALGALGVAAMLGIGFERLVARPIGVRNATAVTVASVGLLSFLLAVEFKWFGASPRIVGAPIDGTVGEIVGIFVSWTQVVSMLLAVAIGFGLNRFLRHSDFGLGVLAAAHDRDMVRLMGVSADRTSAFVWGLGGALAALAALLIEPTVGVFAPGFASELFLKGLAAAVVGGLTSLSGAFVGGLVVGILEAGGQRVFADATLPGTNFLIYLAILLVVLLLRPQGLLGRAEASA